MFGEEGMLYSYKYELVNGHIIALADQFRLLIDTGAPSTVADASPFTIAGRSFEAMENYMGISPESLSESVGSIINALIGADILNQYDILIDPTTQTINMSENEIPLTEQHLELDNFMGIPIIDAMVGEDKIRMFFDTGAKLSYLDPNRTDAFHSVGIEEDFYPGVGEFSTNTYDIPIILGTEDIILRVGNLPQLLHMTLMMANTDGILGTAILQTHKVSLAPRRKKIALQRINS